MTCRDCQFLDVPLNAAGRRAPVKRRLYNCLVPAPVIPCIPESFKGRHQIKFDRKMMAPEYGKDCCGFESLPKR
jgi:hypothetical protein